MSWQDWGDVRNARNKKGDLFSKKNPSVKWSDGDAVIKDVSIAEKRNRRKAMEAQHRAEAKAALKRAAKEKKNDERRQAKAAAQLRKKYGTQA